jgi:hypothetical protein
VVKVGFIVEGSCERIVLNSQWFSDYLVQNQIEQVGEIINLDGKGNLQVASQRIGNQVQLLRDKGADAIIILRDMDSSPCFTAVKQQTFQASDVHCCVIARELEAWFLADGQTLSAIMGIKFSYVKPEDPVKPSSELVKLRREFTGQGISDKKGFSSKMIRNGFTIERAAAHPNCLSARYFLRKLQTLASAS